MSLRIRARATLGALAHLAGGLATALAALVSLPFVVVTLPAAPVAARLVRAVADRERRRAEVAAAPPLPRGWRATVADRAVRRELGWLPVHATLGSALGAAGILLPLRALQDLTFPVWWRFLPPGEATGYIGLWSIDSTASALPIALLGAGWLALLVALGPAAARLQAWPGRQLLGPDPGELALRVAQLTATRAAALDAHAAELRRIERALHDGTQNRIVAVTVLLGAARRAAGRDPATVVAALDRAQDAAEHALAELRSVVRSILPPVLADRSADRTADRNGGRNGGRGLAGALTGLAAACPVPCRVDAPDTGRCPVTVEATAYFMVAEALTNIARHSGATHATVTVRQAAGRLLVTVTDDGRGGAEAGRGTGLDGIRRRAEAHDGTLTLTSPPGGPTTVHVSLPCGS